MAGDSYTSLSRVGIFVIYLWFYFGGKLMRTIFVVKSFGHMGYTNLKAFDCESLAEEYAEEIGRQIPTEVFLKGDEFVEVEELTLEEY
jgi:hypothetical protein